MDVRVEPPSVSTSWSPSRTRADERTLDEPDALLELRLLVLGRRLERALEVVEHGQQLFTSRSPARATRLSWSRATRLR